MRSCGGAVQGVRDCFLYWDGGSYSARPVSLTEMARTFRPAGRLSLEPDARILSQAKLSSKGTVYDYTTSFLFCRTETNINLLDQQPKGARVRVWLKYIVFKYI
jgi:hypothetical protein